MSDYVVGDIVECEVTGVTSYGVFVKLENDYKGLIHISEVSDKFVSGIEEMFKKKDKITAKIIEADNCSKEVKLSIKQMKKNSKKNKSIQEKGEGFKPLKNKLDVWIEEKLKELKN